MNTSLFNKSRKFRNRFTTGVGQATGRFGKSIRGIRNTIGQTVTSGLKFVRNTAKNTRNNLGSRGPPVVDDEWQRAMNAAKQRQNGRKSSGLFGKYSGSVTGGTMKRTTTKRKTSKRKTTKRKTAKRKTSKRKTKKH